MIENKKGGILMQEVTLNQGIKMPQLGFGVFSGSRRKNLQGKCPYGP